VINNREGINVGLIDGGIEGTDDEIIESNKLGSTDVLFGGIYDGKLLGILDGYWVRLALYISEKVVVRVTDGRIVGIDDGSIPVLGSFDGYWFEGNEDGNADGLFDGW